MNEKKKIPLNAKPQRQGREVALQFLTSMELSGFDDFFSSIKKKNVSLEEGIEEEVDKFVRDSLFWNVRIIKMNRTKMFGNILIRGTLNHLKKIDELISENLDNYKLEKLTNIDRNIMRVAVYELIEHKDTPTNIIINEAIDVAKHFGTNKSGGFVNGVLDKVRKEVRKEV